MRKITINNLSRNYEFAVSQIKYFCGENYQMKFEIINALKQNINHISLSERQKESIFEINLKINDKLWKEKTVLFEVNQHFDLMNDIKLQSKSLILRYYETVLEMLSLQDELLTLNTMFKVLENLINRDEQIIHAKFPEMNEKQIIKLVQAILIKEEMQSNIFDFSYEELILLQLEILEYIVNNHFEITYFIIVDIPHLTEKIVNVFSKFNDNVIILIFTNEVMRVENISDYCLCFSNLIDLADEEKIYENVINIFPLYIDYEEVINEMKNIISKNINSRTNLLIDLIK